MVHTRIALLVVLSVAVVTLSTVPAVAAQEDTPQTITYRGIRPDDPLGRAGLHHYSSFSLAHSYSEREGKPFSTDAWMRTPLTLEQVTEAKRPVSDGYFEGSDGAPVPRTPFEYIQDHLGYRLELQSATFPRTAAPGGVFDVEVQLINRGFSTLHNPRPVFLALIKDEVFVATVPVDADPRTWQPYAPGDETYAPLTHVITTPLTPRQDLEPGWYVLGLWLPDQ